ncbi:hypothetical protein FJ444_13230 [Aestuariibacter sp. GS-14]|uniref:TonB-dependent receptor n=1 Tax=Aestuariibacter sp. GS-14 TaxID=2590670 RepID=UPI001126E0DA|nr:TonB-dependent receptor [Aestuariibacter sp. GS-14]TPV57351.1 hypothetical protein FJ444_13230 [Aestuariibacter sp. GS-14]
MLHTKFSQFALSTLAISVALGTNTAGAEEAATEQQKDIEVIMVSAQKSIKPLQKVAASISVVDADSILNAAKVTAADVLSDVAGVEVQGAARGAAVAIRGLGSDLPPGVGESSVSTNYDGVYSIRAEAGVLGFYDMDRVEVLRGPQGTLYGRNATGGVINFISRDPSLDDTSGYVAVGAGNYDFKRVEGAVNLVVSDDVAVRMAATYVDRDGYLSNGHADSKGDGQRLKVLYSPSSEFRLVAGYDRIHLGGMGSGGVEEANWVAGDYYTTADPDIGAGQDYTSEKLYLDLSWQVGPGVLTVLPAYQTGAGTNEGFFGGRGSSGFDPKKIEQNSLEIRYGSLPGETLEWVMGYFHYDYEQYTINDVFNTDGSITVTNEYQENNGESDALFAQLTYHLADDLRLTAGARYTQDKRQAEGSAPPPLFIFDGVRDDSFTDWKLGLEKDLSDSVMVYAQAATGFRPGGVNPFNGGTIVPEDLLAYEAGVKSRLLDNTLQINASGFYYDYADYQVVDFFFSATGPNLVFYNADATNWGGEFELLSIPTDVDRINLAVAYLNSEITSDLCLNPYGYFGETEAVCDGLGANAINFNGERLPHSPEWTIKAGYEHTFVGESGWTLVPRLDLRYVSEQYVAPSNQTPALQDSYITGDATLTWTHPEGHLSVSAFVRNIADEAVKNAFFVGYSIVQPPRMYGMNVNYQF